MDPELRRQIIMENYMHPYNKETTDNSKYIKVNSNNESCIDNINLYLLIEDNIIKDVKFDGEACAISTAATSVMIKLLLNKSIQEIECLISNYENMINEMPYDAEILGEANCFDEIYKQQNRKTCALLPWSGLKKSINEYKKSTNINS